MKSALWVLGLLLAFSTSRSSREQLLKEAKGSLCEAVEKALPGVKDAVPIGARLMEDKGRALFVVRVAQGEGAVRISIDAKTLERVETSPLKKNYSQLVSASKLSFAKAVEAALRKVPGKATRVGFALKKGKPIVEVGVFKDGKAYEVKLDGVTGSVIKVAEDDDDEEDGDDDDGDDDD